MCGDITEGGVFLGHVRLTQDLDSFSGDLNMAEHGCPVGLEYFTSLADKLTKSFNDAFSPVGGRVLWVLGGTSWHGAGVSGSLVFSVSRRRTVPGMAGVWRWRNWADEACCSLPGSQTVSVKLSLCVHLVVLHPAPSGHGPVPGMMRAL